MGFRLVLQRQIQEEKFPFSRVIFEKSANLFELPVRYRTMKLMRPILFLLLCFAIYVGSRYLLEPAPPSEAKKGVHLLLSDTFHEWPRPIWRTHIAAAADILEEGGFVTQLIRSDDLDVEKWQHFLDLCAEFNLTPIVRLATTDNPEIGGWNAPPVDADGSYTTIAGEFAAFVGALEWVTAPTIIVHNEPNHGNEWGGVVDPVGYARYLIAVADALHAVNGDTIVLNAPFDTFAPHTNGEWFLGGPPLTDAESFMDEMVSAEPDVFTHIDGWATHPYPLGAFIQPPWSRETAFDYLNGASNPYSRPVPRGVHNRGINSYEWELYKLEQYGVDELPVYITETGWYNDAPNADIWLDLALRGNNGRYPDQPDATGWIPWLEDDRVVAITPFAFNGDPTRWGRFNWLVLDEDGTILDTTALYEAWRKPVEE